MIRFFGNFFPSNQCNLCNTVTYVKPNEVWNNDLSGTEWNPSTVYSGEYNGFWGTGVTLNRTFQISANINRYNASDNEITINFTAITGILQCMFLFPIQFICRQNGVFILLLPKLFYIYQRH